MTHPEQAARDMLERMGFEDAQSMTAGDVSALANLIANSRRQESRVRHAEWLLRQWLNPMPGPRSNLRAVTSAFLADKCEHHE